MTAAIRSSGDDWPPRALVVVRSFAVCKMAALLRRVVLHRSEFNDSAAGLFMPRGVALACVCLSIFKVSQMHIQSADFALSIIDHCSRLAWNDARFHLTRAQAKVFAPGL